MSDTASSSRTVLVTGATEGIGYETAQRLAAHDYTVVLHAGTTERGMEALERLTNAGAQPSRLDLVTADFASLGEVAKMARHVGETHPRLDLLVNTLTMASPERRILTEDGNEMTFQVNYLAVFMLTRMLEGALRKAPNSRVVTVSSTLHRAGALNWTDLNRTRRYSPLGAYAQSTLALTMFTTALAELWPSATTAVSVDPGSRDRALLRLHGQTKPASVDPAEVITRLCSPNLTVVNGAFYDQLTQAVTAPCVQDPRSVPRLWKLSERLTSLN